MHCFTVVVYLFVFFLEISSLFIKFSFHLLDNAFSVHFFTSSNFTCSWTFFFSLFLCVSICECVCLLFVVFIL